MTTKIGAIFGQHDTNTLHQLEDVASRAERAALMADGHVGYIMPIGGVAAYDNKVSVAGVGYDIACGNAAIRTDLKLPKLAGRSFDGIASNPHGVTGNPVLKELADQIADTLSFGIGRKNESDDAPVDHPLFNDPAWYAIPNTKRFNSYREDLKQKARKQLGTVGSGNHYVDVFVDASDQIWVGVHFGSRGLGHTIASNFMALAKGLEWGERPGPEVEGLLDLESPMGQEYWALMNLAGAYAYAGREWVARKVVSLLGGKELDLVHNHHNFAWKEQHKTDQGIHEFVVVRKGATPAWPGQRGFVGGSMGDDSVVLQGSTAGWNTSPVGDEVMLQQNAALYSTVHGAGRVMSRTAAAGKRNRRTGKQISPGLVSPEMMQEWLKKKGVILRGGGLDESPHAYRRLPDVIREQGATVEVLHLLRPLIVVMAGANEYDPFKD